MDTLSFKVSGEWITKYARELFWECHKSYQDVEELLLNCLVTDELNLEERKDIAQDIIEGKCKLVGINTFTVEDDGTCIRKLREALSQSESNLVEISNKVDELKHRTEELVSEIEHKDHLAETKEAEYRLSKIKDAMKNTNMLFPIEIELRNITKDDIEFYANYYNLMYRQVRWAMDSWIQFYKDDEVCSPEYLRSIGALNDLFLENADSIKSRDNDLKDKDCDFKHYGWLAPDGSYVRADFGDHEQAALKIIDEHDWHQDYYSKDDRPCDIYLAGDYLVKERGYALLHNPYGYGYTKLSSPDRLTKRQKEFLYSYFLYEGNTTAANSLYTDED